MHRKIYTHCLCFILAICLLGCTTSTKNKEVVENKKGEKEEEIVMNNENSIKLQINEEIVTIEIYDTPTGNELVSILPVTLTIENFSTNEKIAELPTILTLEGAPNGHTPSKGDVTIYGPWGNIAMFIENGNYASGLVPIGRVLSGIEILENTTPGTIAVLAK